MNAPDIRAMCLSCLVVLALAANCSASAAIADQMMRSKQAGVDVIVYPMAVKDLVTIAGSLPAGSAQGLQGNVTAAVLTGMLLNKGTTTEDKFTIAKKLDEVGAQLAFFVGNETLNINARAIKKDVPLVMRLLAEELRSPAFSQEEFDKAKKQFEAALRQSQEDTDVQAADAFSRAIYPYGHPNRQVEVSNQLLDLQRLTITDVKDFYSKHYGAAHFSLVFVGDVDAAQIRKEVARSFAGWNGGGKIVRAARGTEIRGPREQTITMVDKASVSVVLGQSTGLLYLNPDSLALRVGTAILGSGFTGRLMATVRDREGLTYGITASVADDDFVDGTWMINAAFAPQNLAQGIASTRRELDKWWRDGVTADELAARKTNMEGAYRVSLASTTGMAISILENVNRGEKLTWLDELPNAIDALTLDQVNAAIKKYLDPQKMVLVTAGTPAPAR